MKKVNRLSFIILGVIMAISVVLLVSLLSSLSENSNDPAMGRWIDTNLTWTYILFAATAGLAVLFALYQTLTNLKAAKGGLLGIGFLVLVVVFSYVISSGDIPKFPGAQKFIEDGTLTANVSKWIDTGLIVVYSLLGIAVISLIYSSVSRLFSR